MTKKATFATEPKATFAAEGIQPRNILTDEVKKERLPKEKKVAKNQLRTYVTDAEMQAAQDKAGDVPLATFLRNFLRENGFFD